MGVLGLWNVIESVGHPIKVDGLEGKRLGVDANVWLYKFIRGFREKDNVANLDSHKLGLFNRISKLLYYKIKPVFVFDGPAPVLKRRTLEKRQNTRHKNLTKVQDAAMKVLAEQLKKQYPDAKIDDLKIQLPKFESNNLVAAEKLTDEDRELFYLPPDVREYKAEDDDDEDEDNKLFSSDSSDSDCVEISPVKQEKKYRYDDPAAQYHHASAVNVNSEDFENLPAEIRYEILTNIKQSKKRILNAEALPEDANSFSNLQLQRLRARRSIQEKIEKCEKDICTSYTGEFSDGHSIQAFRVQSDAASTMILRNNKAPATTAPETATTTTSSSTPIQSTTNRYAATKKPTADEYRNLFKMPLNFNDFQFESDVDDDEDDDDNVDSKEKEKNIDKTVEILSSSDSSDSDYIEVLTTQEKREQSTINLDSEDSINSSPIAKVQYDVRTNEDQSKKRVLNAYPDEAESFSDLQSVRSNETEKDVCTDIGQADQVQSEPSTMTTNRDSLSDTQTTESPPRPTQQISSSTIPTAAVETEAESTSSLSSATTCASPEATASSKSEIAEVTLETTSPAKAELPSTTPAAIVDSEEAATSTTPVAITKTTPTKSATATTPTIAVATTASKAATITTSSTSPIPDITTDAEVATASPSKTTTEPTPIASTAVESNVAEPQASQPSEASQSSSAPKSTYSYNAHNKVTTKIVEEAKELLRLFGIPYIDAAGEAEAQCALLEELKLTDGTITDDSDIWLFGAQNVYRYFFSDDKYVMQYKMTDIEYHVRLTRENLVCFAMLVGSDYTDGVMNIGPVKALEILAEFPGEGLEPLVKFKQWHDGYKKSHLTKGELKQLDPFERKLIKKYSRFQLADEFPSGLIFDGYMHPSADSSPEEFVWGTPELDELREYARRHFGWEPKRIDEKLLPVMKRLSERRTQKTIDSFFQVSRPQQHQQHQRKVRR